jgi:hypothetical protein
LADISRAREPFRFFWRADALTVGGMTPSRSWHPPAAWRMVCEFAARRSAARRDGYGAGAQQTVISFASVGFDAVDVLAAAQETLRAGSPWYS